MKNSQSAIDIQLAVPEDLAELLTIERAAQLTPWSEQMLLSSLVGDDSCWKLISDDEIVGFMIALVVLDQLELLNIVISPSHQGQGLASLLIEHLENHAKTSGIVSIFLEVRESNMAAIHLYQKYGFSQIGARKNYYQNPQENSQNAREDALVMRLDL